MAGICLAAASVLLAYPVVAGWAAKSETPRWLGRYSTFLLLFNVAGTLLLCCSPWAWRRAPGPVLFCAALLSVLPLGNNILAGLPGLVFTMWLLRFLSAFGMVVHAFDVSRRGGRASLVLATGTMLFALTAADFVLFGVARLRAGQSVGSQAYRYPYDLSQITDRDLVLVGDSFVWGQGVPEGREFGALMQAGNHLWGGRVFSLGEIGTGPAQYLKSISNIPPACRSGRIIVCYYHNDMPTPERFVDRIQSLGASVGRGVPTLRFVGDMLAKNLTPTPDDYLRQLVENYSAQHRGHAERWALLRQQLDLCFAAAKLRSIERPGLLILPGLLDFRAYPFATAHQNVGAMAADIGFEVFDSLAAFQSAGIPAKDLWASPNDPHFNERGHQITAEFLSGRLRLGTELLK